MKRNTSMDYRGYQVEPPRSWQPWWQGTAKVYGMPNLVDTSESGLRDRIDRAWKECTGNTT